MAEDRSFEVLQQLSSVGAGGLEPSESIMSVADEIAKAFRRAEAVVQQTAELALTSHSRTIAPPEDIYQTLSFEGISEFLASHEPFVEADTVVPEGNSLILAQLIDLQRNARDLTRSIDETTSVVRSRCLAVIRGHQWPA